MLHPANEDRSVIISEALVSEHAKILMGRLLGIGRSPGTEWGRGESGYPGWQVLHSKLQSPGGMPKLGHYWPDPVCVCGGRVV